LKGKLRFKNDHLFVALINEIESLIQVFKISHQSLEQKASIQGSNFLIILSNIEIKRYSIPSFELELFLLLPLQPKFY
jgi:hypothetical protein